MACNAMREHLAELGIQVSDSQWIEAVKPAWEQSFRDLRLRPPAIPDGLFTRRQAQRHDRRRLNASQHDVTAASRCSGATLPLPATEYAPRRASTATISYPRRDAGHTESTPTLDRRSSTLNPSTPLLDQMSYGWDGLRPRR